MPKGRIGLSLSEDVLAILDCFGRNETIRDPLIRDLASTRPSRTQIIEEAVRLWARQRDHTNGRAGNVKSEPSPREINETYARLKERSAAQARKAGVPVSCSHGESFNTDGWAGDGCSLPGARESERPTESVKGALPNPELTKALDTIGRPDFPNPQPTLDEVVIHRQFKSYGTGLKQEDFGGFRSFPKPSKRGGK